MTAHEKKLVQESFEKVVPSAAIAATLFYNRLFELDPSLRPIFRVNLEQQVRKFMEMLTMIVVGLDRMEETIPVVRSLGARHAGYGVTDQHYDTFAEALLWTLEQGLGAAFTPAVKSAWVKVCTLLAGEMKTGALQASAA